MDAIRAYDRWGHVAGELENIGDTTGAVQERAAQNAASMASNLKNLQTAWLAFASDRLQWPLEKLTGFLNHMAEHPKIATTAMWGLVGAVTALGAIKIGAGIISLVANLKMLTGGGGINLGGLANAGGGAGIPVHVTNWGGAAGSPALPAGQPASGQPAGTPTGAPRISYGKAAGGGAIMGAVFAIPKMVGELFDISDNEELTETERSKATGGAIGEAAGTIGGMAAGAAAGAAIGSVVPVAGTAIGALLGGAIGFFGGMLGREVGESVGEGLAYVPPNMDEELQKLSVPPELWHTLPSAGAAEITTRVDVYDNRVEAQTFAGPNDTGFKFDTGHARDAQGMGM
jgi:hypothetical protein